MNSLKLEDFKVWYTDTKSNILDIDSIQFYSGINFIIGKNGSGKSTLLKALSNHDHVVSSGTITFNNKILGVDSIGIVEQNPLNSLTGELTFAQNLIQARSSVKQLYGLGLIESKRELDSMAGFLSTLDLSFNPEELFNKKASSLSSGQLQLLAILMRIYRDGNILLLDECTANLDAENTELILNTLQHISKKEVVILFVTHQWELLDTENSKTYKIEHGKIFKA